MSAGTLPLHLQTLFDAIMKAHPDGLTLNQLSEELLNKQVTYADIELLIEALEDADVDLEAPEQPARPEELASVLAAVRTLTGELGRRPTPIEIAEKAGLTPAAVRRALQLGRSVGP